MHDHAKTKSGPETTGVTIHWTSQHDIFARLMGLGVNGSNSRTIIEMAKIKPGDKVLDMGCGTGDLTLTAAKSTGASGSAYGIDAAPEGIEIARKKAKRSGVAAIFNVGLIEKLDFADANFDVVISRLVIHHLPDDLKRRGFEEIFRVLKPGGRVFLADFKPPTNPLLAHAAIALVGHRMMVRSNNAGSLSSLIAEAGFGNVVSEPKRSMFLLYVSGKKPAS
ncbi:MAG: methyltransferase domain-containing protein [Chloroflexi bacterium]|nr:methyltransferase domain-containing protein [Chloroflexota bacterium]